MQETESTDEIYLQEQLAATWDEDACRPMQCREEGHTGETWKHQGDDDDPAEKEEESASSRSMHGTSLFLRAARVGRSGCAREDFRARSLNEKQ
jgi:hypothetical protein